MKFLYPLSRSLIKANIMLGVLATCAVALRLLARQKRNMRLGMDDYTIILSLIFALGLNATAIYAGATNSFGGPQSSLTNSEYVQNRKLIYADVLICHQEYGMIKISVVLFCKRIFTTPRFMMTANIFLVIIICWMITALFSQLFALWPIDAFWNVRQWWKDPEIPNISYSIWLLVMAAIDVALDIATLLLPLPAINTLHISLKRKVSLIGIFGLGTFCVVASVIRIYYSWLLHQLQTGQLPQMVLEHPLTFSQIGTWNFIWAHIEACVSIVTACLPMLAPLLGSWISQIRRWISQSWVWICRGWQSMRCSRFKICGLSKEGKNSAAGTKTSAIMRRFSRKNNNKNRSRLCSTSSRNPLTAINESQNEWFEMSPHTETFAEALFHTENYHRSDSDDTAVDPENRHIQILVENSFGTRVEDRV